MWSFCPARKRYSVRLNNYLRVTAVSAQSAFKLLHSVEPATCQSGPAPLVYAPQSRHPFVKSTERHL